MASRKRKQEECKSDLAEERPVKQHKLQAINLVVSGTLQRLPWNLVKSCCSFLDLPGLGLLTGTSKVWNHVRQDRALVESVWANCFRVGLAGGLGRAASASTEETSGKLRNPGAQIQGIACQRCLMWSATARTFYYCSACVATVCTVESKEGVGAEMQRLPEYKTGKLVSDQARSTSMKRALAKEFIMSEAEWKQAREMMTYLASTGEKQTMLEYLKHLQGVSLEQAHTLLCLVRASCPQFHGPLNNASTGLANPFMDSILPRIMDPWTSGFDWTGLDQQDLCRFTAIMSMLDKAFAQSTLEDIKTKWNNPVYRATLQKSIIQYCMGVWGL